MPEQDINPYRIDEPATHLFYGRRGQLVELAACLCTQTPGSYGLLGGRRFGKTTFLLVLERHLLKLAQENGPYPHRVLPVYMNLMGDDIGSVADFFSLAAERLVEQIGEHGRGLDAGLASMRPANTKSTPYQAFVASVRNLCKSVASSDRPLQVALLLDEAEEILAMPWGHDLFNRLRFLISDNTLSNQILKVVVAGSSGLREDTRRRGSPLWNVLDFRLLTAFDDKESMRLITEPCGAQFPEAAAQEIVRLSGGHPFLIQYFMHNLWAERHSQVSPERVQVLGQSFCRERWSQLESWRQTLGGFGCRAYVHLLEQGNWMSEHALRSSLHPTARTFGPTMDTLQYHGLVIRDTDMRYRAVGGLFYQWLKEEGSACNHGSQWENWQWRSSSGDLEIPPGVVREILTGKGDRLPNERFNEQYRDDISTLAISAEDRRVRTAVHLWDKLWLEEPGLPNMPLMAELARIEFSGEMYSEYRDHVVHSLWVYLLGLCLYRGSPAIAEAVRRHFAVESEFLLSWKIAALFHDIGYTCDKGIDAEQSYLGPLLARLFRLARFPICGYLRGRGLELSEEDESELSRISDRPSPSLYTLDLLEKGRVLSDDSELLDWIEPLAIPTRLAQDGNPRPLKSYHLLTKTVKSDNRERFRDHGILSALILLYQFRVLDTSLQKLKGISIPLRISRDTRLELATIAVDPITERVRKPLQQAAAAIALHNVSPGIFSVEREKAKDEPYFLSLSDFRIDLDESPMSFLLALTDVLQCWDRPKRRYVEAEEDLSLPSSRVSIVCDGDVIHWHVKPDARTGKVGINPPQEIEKMSQYLSCRGRKGVSQLIRGYCE